MDQRDNRRALSPQRAGLLIAVAFALIAAGVLLFVAVGRKRPNAAPVSPAPAEIASPAVRPPVGPDAISAGPGAGLRESGRARLQFNDRNDPDRVASQLEWLTLEPDPEQRRRSLVTEPRAWIYLRDGRSIHVRAAQGQIYMPDQSREPESGRFWNGVVIRLFERPEVLANGEVRAIDPERDRPALLVLTDSLSFDSAFGEVSTQDRVHALTEELEFIGTGLRVQLNEVQDRIEFLRVDRGQSIRYRRVARENGEAAQPGAVAAAETPTGETPDGQRGAAARDAGVPAVAAGSAIEPAPAAVAAAPAAPKEDRYHATFMENVRVVQEGRVLDADVLDVWARIVGGRLPDDALGAPGEDAEPTQTRTAGVPAEGREPALDGAPRETVASSDTRAGTPNGPAHASGVGPAGGEGRTDDALLSAFARPTEDDLVLTWTGPLELHPRDDVPVELDNGSHLALRFTAPTRDTVAFRDAEGGLSGRAAQIDYAATQRLLTLAGPDENSVELVSQRGQRVLVRRTSIGLATGIVTVPSGGTLEDGARRVTWSDQADFLFATRGGTISGDLREAILAGTSDAQVRASDERSSLAGDWVRTTFATGRDGQLFIMRLIVEGNAVGDGGDAGSLRADQIDVGFAPGDGGRGEPDPTILSATGNVRAQRADAVLTADFLESGLARNERGSVIATDVLAQGSVRFERADGVGATADELVADAVEQTARLTGLPATVFRTSAVVSGGTILLDGQERAMRVDGPGTFELRRDPARTETGARVAEVRSSWSRSLLFLDAAGQIETEGDIVAVTDPTGETTNTVRGDRLRMFITPLSEASQAGGPGRASAGGRGTDTLFGAFGEEDQGGGRELLRAIVYGTDAPGRDGRARVDSRRFARAAAPGVERGEPIQHIYLEGHEIVADEVDGTLVVPGPGLALIDDRRMPEPATPAEIGRLDNGPGQGGAGGAGGAGGGPIGDPRNRGTSLFSWAGGMTMNRGTGLLTMQRTVRLLHRPLRSPEVTELEAETLTALLRSRAEEGDEPAPALAGGRATELQRAQAEGAVYIRTVGGESERQLLADRVTYDAIAGTALAEASPENRVTLFDNARGTAWNARSLFWDMVRDRIEVREQTPIVVPRTGR